MLTISKPLGTGQVQSYYHTDYNNAKDNYYTQGATVRGEWQGMLAAHWGLNGEVDGQMFDRLAEGNHPITGEELIRHQTSASYTNAKGETVNTMAHRAGWDAVFSAPKSVSLTALVGGDERVKEAHRASVAVALDEIEKFVQARIGGNNPAETTGQWVVAKFEHDSARPADGYSAPQLHTHSVIFNMTTTADGQVRSLQTKELYQAQRFATAVYRSELAAHLRALGYEVETRKHVPEIKGYSQEYIEASSPRSQQMKAYMEEQGVSGARAAEIAAHQTRSAKEYLPQEEVLARHHQLATEHGDQPQQVVAAAAQRKVVELHPRSAENAADVAMQYALSCSMERTAVDHEHALLCDALQHSIGAARLPELRAEFERQVEMGTLIEVQRRPGAAGRVYVTPEMVAYEQEIIDAMQAGKTICPVLVDGASRQWATEKHTGLNKDQQQAVDCILTNCDRMMALEGVAGAGKTTALKPVNDAAVHDGYIVQGLAPTSRAAQKLADAGMKTETLQMHLTRNKRGDDGQKRLYIIDESSMISTKQMHMFLSRLKENDRVLFVGDTRQHEAVQAGRPYAQLLDAEMRTAHLKEIIRQKEAALKAAVLHLTQAEVMEAVAALIEQGRVHEDKDRVSRVMQIAHDYARQPEKTLAISPDNRSRCLINSYIHAAMQDAGHVLGQDYPVRVLIARQDMATADRLYAQNYEVGEVLLYAKSSKKHGVGAGEYAQITDIDRAANVLTVTRQDGKSLSYDPRHLSGVTVYEEAERNFAVGDRVQITTNYHAQKLANRELGTVKKIDGEGHLRLRMDPLNQKNPGREVEFSTRNPLHLDYGYAVTSHSSQGQTVNRVLIHVDTEHAPGRLHNKRMAYVAVSRAEFDVQIYTDAASSLAEVLSRNVSHLSALQQTPVDCAIGPQSAGIDEIMPDFGTGTKGIGL